MGRPLNKRYFGNNNPDDVGGEGLASITLGGTNNSSGYTTGDALTINAPQIAGGTQAVGTVIAYGNGKISGTSITTTGSGYTSFTISAGTGTQGTLTLTGVATANGSARANAIIPQVRISGTNRTSGNDIIKQKGPRKFICKSQDGQALCTLVARTPAAAGEMAIVATDSQNSTYWVRKITGRKVELVQNSNGGTGFDFADGDTAKWTITGSASAPVGGGFFGSDTTGAAVADLGTVVLNNA